MMKFAPRSLTAYLLNLLALLALGACTPQAPTQKEEDPLQGIEADIAALLEAYQAVGLAVAVVQGDQTVYTGGFGYRDLEKQLPVTDSTVFAIASVSKSFTGAMLGILAGESKLSLQDKPSQHIPNFRFYQDDMNRLITLEDLLCHKSGIGVADASLVFFPSTDKVGMVQRLAHIPPEGTPNDSWIYSNMGYTVAGTVVEQVAQKPWAAYLQEKVFTPLEMTHSHTTLEGMQASGNFAYGYGRLNGETQKLLFEEFLANEPAGGVRSTAADMAHYITAWLNEGHYKGQPVLPAEYVQKATTMHNIMPQADADAEVYLFGDGLGWRVRSHKGHYKVHHGGNTAGFSTQVVMFPNEKLGIAVMTNQHNSILPYILVDAITNRMLGLPQTPVDQYPVVVTDIYPIAENLGGLNTAAPPSLPLSAYAGQYTAQGYGTLEVSVEADHLVLTLPGFRFGLKHLEGDGFAMDAIEDFPQVVTPDFGFNFQVKGSGVASVKMQLAYDVEFVRE